MEIQIIASNARGEALDLILRTFLKYEAPDYSAQGVQTFHDTVICNEDYLNGVVLYGAFAQGDLLGVIATRNAGSHIALFFVEGTHHRQGIGKALFHRVLENCPTDRMTVNSSPYAVPVYHRLGFSETAPEQTTDGMRYTPMERLRRSNS